LIPQPEEMLERMRRAEYENVSGSHTTLGLLSLSKT